MALQRRYKKTRKNKRRTVSRRRRAKRQRGGAAIPRTVIQTSKEPIPTKVTDQLKKYLTGWEYKYFSDDDIVKFFTDTPLDEFPDMTGKFKSFTSGEHKADLFRYYYLYINGGLFMDSDLMAYDDMTSIIGENKFVSIWALRPEGSVFNGFLAAAPKHPILYEALKGLYLTTNDQLQKDYTLVCKNLGGLVKGNQGEGIKMLREVSNNDTFCKIEDPDSQKISLIHYQSMDIPDQPPT